MSSPITIALVWHQMNSDNLGVGALTLSNLDILRDACRDVGKTPKFLVVGWRDPRPWYETPPDVENVPIRLRHIGSPTGPLTDALRRADIVFDIGGGDSFADIYGARRFWTVAGTKIRTLLSGKPLVLSPQTIGPFDARWAQVVARAVISRSRAVVTRDALSTQYLEGLGASGTKILEATDVAMRLGFGPPASQASRRTIKVGLNVSGLLMNGGYTGANQFGLSVDYPALIREIVAWFAEQENVELNFVGHVQSKDQAVEDDQRAGEALGKEFPGTIVAPWFKSPRDAKSYIADMDFFIGARMHATIAAFSAGVPVVAMAYSRKFAGLFNTLGYSHVVDCKSDSAATILSVIQRDFQARDQVRNEVLQSRARAADRLDAYRALAANEISRAGS